MSIGPDLKEVVQDVGQAMTIVRDSGNVTGEYLDYEPNSQVTKPFIREFFLEAMLAYDTAAVVGDVLKFNTTDKYFLLMNKTPQMFENEVIAYDAVLYKCNVSGELSRPSGEVWPDATYHKTAIFTAVSSDCYGLQTEPLFGHSLESDEELGLIGLEKHELYLPSSIGTEVLDRYEPYSGEYYQVESVKKRRYEGVDVIELGEDTR